MLEPLIIQYFYHTDDGLWSGKAHEWFTAIGTVGATIAALFSFFYYVYIKPKTLIEIGEAPDEQTKKTNLLFEDSSPKEERNNLLWIRICNLGRAIDSRPIMVEEVSIYTNQELVIVDYAVKEVIENKDSTITNVDINYPEKIEVGRYLKFYITYRSGSIRRYWTKLKSPNDKMFFQVKILGYKIKRLPIHQDVVRRIYNANKDWLQVSAAKKD